MKLRHQQSYLGSGFQNTSIVQKISLQHLVLQNKKMFRSHYVTMTLKRAVVSKQNLPCVLNYGWEIVENNIIPILTDNLPAPLALIE